MNVSSAEVIQSYTASNFIIVLLLDTILIQANGKFNLISLIFPNFNLFIYSIYYSGLKQPLAPDVVP